MNDNPRQFRTNAETEMRLARETTLANVRERCERSAAAWTAMADRAERVNASRLQREAATAERLEA